MYIFSQYHSLTISLFLSLSLFLCIYLCHYFSVSISLTLSLPLSFFTSVTCCDGLTGWAILGYPSPGTIRKNASGSLQGKGLVTDKIKWSDRTREVSAFLEIMTDTTAQLWLLKITIFIALKINPINPKIPKNRGVVKKIVFSET